MALRHRLSDGFAFIERMGCKVQKNKKAWRFSRPAGDSCSKIWNFGGLAIMVVFSQL